jgi:hypothetical protein
MKPVCHFSELDAQTAFDKVGSNCGPGALASLCNITPL